MLPPSKINTYDNADLEQLCRQIRSVGSTPNSSDHWPRQQFDFCRNSGVLNWFLPAPWGAQWPESDIAKAYIDLASSCLTTTFIITQYVAASRRIAACENEDLKQHLLGDLATGEKFVTVGISHLTTSHRHLSKPVLQASATNSGWLLNGFSPWVTSASQADFIVTGAVVVDEEDPENAKQILLAVPTSTSGITIGASNSLVGLSSSQTGRVEFKNVTVEASMLMAGPHENVLATLSLGSTGGLQTSALAIGLAKAAIGFMVEQSVNRPDLISNVEAFQSQRKTITSQLLGIAAGESDCSKEEIRTAANSLAIRATQAALVAAKGAGYVEGHPVGRWCRESLFFLVWSCPQAVRDANLCEFANMS